MGGSQRLAPKYLPLIENGVFLTWVGVKDVHWQLSVSLHEKNEYIGKCVRLRDRCE